MPRRPNVRPHVLVIASDSELSRSLHFALEAEEFTVSWRINISAHPMPCDYDCTVVDHHALGHDAGEAERFVQAFAPVVLLANGAHPLSPQVFRTVTKPHLGAPLIEAVRDGVATATAPK